MPIVKIHISSTMLPFQKPILVKEVRKVLVELLDIHEQSCQAILYEAPPQLRSVHESRSSNFVYVEITMHPGMDAQLKSSLLQRISSVVSKYTEVELKDISCCIIETPPENWY